MGREGGTAVLRLRDEGIAWREIAGETLLLDLHSSMYLTVNPSAALLWHQLAAGTTREELVRSLVDEYDIAVEQASQDVDAFLDDCRARHYLEDVDR